MGIFKLTCAAKLRAQLQNKNSISILNEAINNPLDDALVERVDDHLKSISTVSGRCVAAN